MYLPVIYRLGLLLFSMITIIILSIFFRKVGKDDVKKQATDTVKWLKRVSMGRESAHTKYQNITLKDILRKKEPLFVRYRNRVLHALEVINLKISFFEFIVLSLGGGIIFAIVMAFLRNKFVQIIAFGVGCYMPLILVEALVSMLQDQVYEDIGPVVSAIVGDLTAATTSKPFVKSVEVVLPRMNKPLKGYFEEFINEMNNTSTNFEEAMGRLARKINYPIFDMFADLAVTYNNEGGDTVYALTSIPEEIKVRRLLRSEEVTATFQYKRQLYILMLAMPIMLYSVKFINATAFVFLVHNPIGKVLVGLDFLVLIVIGVIGNKILRPSL